MIILCHSHNHHLLTILHAPHLQQFWLFLKHFHVGDGKRLRRLSSRIGNLMMWTKITKDGGCHTIRNGHDEGNAIGTSSFIQSKQFLLWQKFGHHNCSIRTMRSQNILGQHDLISQCITIRLGKNIHTTKGIQSTQLSQTRLGQRHIPLLNMLRGDIKVTPPMHLLTHNLIPKHHTTHITQNQILRSLHAHTRTPYNENVQILETGNGITAKGCLLTVDAFGFVIDIGARFVGTHPISPGYCFFSYHFVVVFVIIVVVGANSFRVVFGGITSCV
mmetsp:Transcript_12336/g.26802  ORF Transcript_12336/g.26802 Transcript_12336/m.26802 type:complete len:274 (-) Transcript_12336:133-954(-)